MKIPCKECIALAVCRLKTSIECDALVEFSNYLWTNQHKYPTPYWAQIKKHLPNVEFLYDNESTDGHMGIVL